MAKAKPKKKIQKKTRKERLADMKKLISATNTGAGHMLVKMANHQSVSYLLRRPTGIPSLDLALAGGFPASSTSVIAGPDGAGKDYLVWRMVAEQQKLYGDEFAMVIYQTEFPLDKRFAREFCGVEIGFTDEELDEIDEALVDNGLEPFSEEKRKEYKRQVGDIYVIQGGSAEEAFDEILDYTAVGACQLIIVNSIGFLETEAKLAVDSLSDHPQQRSEASLLKRFCTSLSNILNRGLDHGTTQNETTIILVDQVRAKDGASLAGRRFIQDRDKYRSASGAWALKHGKACEIILHKGRVIRNEKDKSAPPLGREINWEITKGKLGTHDLKRGSFYFLFEGGADVVTDLIGLCREYDVIETRGAWYYYETKDISVKANGEVAFRKKIEGDPVLADLLTNACLRAAQIAFRHT